jgi:predicted small lipoprotein YifL
MRAYSSARGARGAAFTMIALLLLGACGQRGPLVLPDAPATTVPTPAADDQTDNDDEDDGER